jgi:hypothetical protein
MEDAGLQDLIIVLITLGIIIYFAGGFKNRPFQSRDAPLSRFAHSTPGRNLRTQQLARERAERRDHRHGEDLVVPPTATDVVSDAGSVSPGESVMMPETSARTTPERTETTQEEVGYVLNPKLWMVRC